MGTIARTHVQLAVRPWKLDRWGGGMSMDEPFRRRRAHVDAQPGVSDGGVESGDRAAREVLRALA